MVGVFYPGQAYPAEGPPLITSQDGTAMRAGVSMTISVGQPTAFGVVTEPPVVIVGRLIHHRREQPSVDAIARPKGVQARSAVGRVSAAGTATARPAGVELRSAVGTPIPRVDASVDVTGVEARVSLGQATAFDLHVIAVQPYAPIQRDGLALPLFGVSLRASVGRAGATGEDGIDRAWTALQQSSDDDLMMILGALV